MIVGTAGHIDHGKTTLVRALTGVDTDRLKEEKARGISIELGYAYTPLPNGDVLGFIDVPGHEKLVHTMAAGASGIDFALLVVAADDGVMPQTHEHLAILGLLGITRGAIALTKTDRCDAQQRQYVEHDIAQVAAGTFLQDAPVFVTQAHLPGDEGVARLKAYLDEQAQAAPQEAISLARDSLTSSSDEADSPFIADAVLGESGSTIPAQSDRLFLRSESESAENAALVWGAAHQQKRAASGLFRLAIDRAFTLSGRGTIVTGTVHSGRVQAENEPADLRLMPSGAPVRVRGIHAQNRASPEGVAGQRCALNLAGIDKDAIARGDWIADARCFLPSRHVDVSLQWLVSADGPLQAWMPLHVHIGAAHYVAHAVPLAPDSLMPGRHGRVQLVFDTPVCAMPGDRYIVRNAQASRTVGGGMVLDPNAPDRKRRAPQRLAWLDAVSAYLAGHGLEAVLRQAPLGLDEAALQRLCGQAAANITVPPNAQWVAARGSRALILDSHWDALRDRAVSALESFHQQAPDEPGLDAARLRRIAAPTAAEPLWQAALDQLIQEGRVERNGAWLHSPRHVAALAGPEAELAAKVLPRLRDGAYDPPWVRDLARDLGEPEERIRQLLRKLLRRGEIAQVVKDLFYHRERITALAALAAQLCKEKGSVQAADFRDAVGLGRKRSIQILEFFDRVGYTRRLRDTHVLRADSAVFL